MPADDQHKPQDQHPPARTKAVALKGDGTLDTPPQITAVGFGKTADQILDIAFANDVKVRQDADLTEILAALEVESPVPIEALDTVSEILNYVYGLNRRMGEQTDTENTDSTTEQQAGQNASGTADTEEQEPKS